MQAKSVDAAIAVETPEVNTKAKQRFVGANMVSQDSNRSISKAAELLRVILVNGFPPLLGLTLFMGLWAVVAKQSAGSLPGPMET